MSFPGNMQAMLEQAQKLQERFREVQDEVGKKEVEGTSGGGMVTVRMNGKQEILSLRIDPSVVTTDDVEMLEDLVRSAVNVAIEKSRSLMKDELSALTGGLPIPGFS